MSGNELGGQTTHGKSKYCYVMFIHDVVQCTLYGRAMKELSTDRTFLSIISMYINSKQ